MRGVFGHCAGEGGTVVWVGFDCFPEYVPTGLFHAFELKGSAQAGPSMTRFEAPFHKKSGSSCCDVGPPPLLGLCRSLGDRIWLVALLLSP